MDSIHFSEEHRMLRDQIRRFVEQEVQPVADAWEVDGMVPRDVLRKMGDLGFLGIRAPELYGGSAMDTMGTAILSEELGRSSFGGFAITVLVHTDMASPHMLNFGNQAQLEKYLPGMIKGETITAIAGKSVV